MLACFIVAIFACGQSVNYPAVEYLKARQEAWKLAGIEDPKACVAITRTWWTPRVKFSKEGKFYGGEFIWSGGVKVTSEGIRYPHKPDIYIYLSTECYRLTPEIWREVLLHETLHYMWWYKALNEPGFHSKFSDSHIWMKTLDKDWSIEF